MLRRSLERTWRKHTPSWGWQVWHRITEGTPCAGILGLVARVSVLPKAGSLPSAPPRPGLLSAELRASLGLLCPGQRRSPPAPCGSGDAGGSQLLSISQRASPRPAALRNSASPLPRACWSSLSVFSRLHQGSQRVSKRAKCSCRCCFAFGIRAERAAASAARGRPAPARRGRAGGSATPAPSRCCGCTSSAGLHTAAGQMFPVTQAATLNKAWAFGS